MSQVCASTHPNTTRPQGEKRLSVKSNHTTHNTRSYFWALLSLAWFGAFVWLQTGCGAGMASGFFGPEAHKKGQRDFTTSEFRDGGKSNSGGEERFGSPIIDGGATGKADSGPLLQDAKPKAPDEPKNPTPPPDDSKNELPLAPSEQGAVLHQVKDNVLYHLNTYQGLLLFDVKDPRKPKRLVKLHVYGHPVEMHFVKNRLYILVNDVLQLYKNKTKLTFARQHTAQLISVDITKPSAAKILQRIDLPGKMQKGLSLVVDSFLYLLTQTAKGHSSGWSYESKQPTSATVLYSFELGTSSLKQSKKLIITKAAPVGGVQGTFERSSQTLAQGALLIRDVWTFQKTTKTKECNITEDYKETLLRIIRLRGAKGNVVLPAPIRLRGTLKSAGNQTYTSDSKGGNSRYLGIFQKNEQIAVCPPKWEKRLALVSVEDDPKQQVPKTQSLLFGSKDAIPAASFFDHKRQLAFVSTDKGELHTLQLTRGQPLKALHTLKQIAPSLRRLQPIDSQRFLLGIGTDKSCGQLKDSKDKVLVGTKISLSLFDTAKTSGIREVQKKCISIEHTKTSNAELLWKVDEALDHIQVFPTQKLITMPLHYTKQTKVDAWPWNEYKSIVGLVRWDLKKYDAQKSGPSPVFEQLTNFRPPIGNTQHILTYQRTVLSKPRLTFVGLSDTHLTLGELFNNITPRYLASLEISLHIRSVYRFGSYLVEQSSLGPKVSDFNEFRVKKLTLTSGSSSNKTNIDYGNAPTVATFKIGAFKSVVRWNHLLIFFRHPTKNGKEDTSQGEIRLYDLSTPPYPKPRGLLTLPYNFSLEYEYYSGNAERPFRFKEEKTQTWVRTEHGIAVIATNRQKQKVLLAINLTNTIKPTFQELPLDTRREQFYPIRQDDRHLYVVSREAIGSSSMPGVQDFRYFATSWSLHGTGNWSQNSWKEGKAINTPGRLLRAFQKADGKTILLSYERIPQPRDIEQPEHVKLYLLEESNDRSHATLAAWQDFKGWRVHDLLLNGQRIYLTTERFRPTPKPGQGSHFLRIFEVSSGQFTQLLNVETLISGLRLMGVHKQRLVTQIKDTGLLLFDVQKPTQPRGIQFRRTFQWIKNIEFLNEQAFAASGHFGIYQIDLNKESIPERPAP